MKTMNTFALSLFPFAFFPLDSLVFFLWWRRRLLPVRSSFSSFISSSFLVLLSASYITFVSWTEAPERKREGKSKNSWKSLLKNSLCWSPLKRKVVCSSSSQFLLYMPLSSLFIGINFIFFLFSITKRSRRATALQISAAFSRKIYLALKSYHSTFAFTSPLILFMTG